jgi:1-acyl-sn-glycerol-3-phosphate acyltransferase
MDRITELAKKHIVIIYPEGTRSTDGKLGKGKSAVGKIMLESGATVIPAAIFNTQYCLPKGEWKPRFFLPLAVVFGKPVDLAKYINLPPDKETAKEVVNEVMRSIAALQMEYSKLDVSSGTPPQPERFKK